MPIPIFNRNQGNILNAEGRFHQQQKELDRIQLALMDSLAGTFRQYQSLRAQAEQLQKEILPRAKEVLDLTTEGYEARRVDFQRVPPTARQSYYQTRLAAIDTLTELHKVLIEIKGLQLTGGPQPHRGRCRPAGEAEPVQPGARNVLLQRPAGTARRSQPTLPGAIQAGER